MPFEYPFTISKGSKTEQPTLLVELEHLGLRGYGEAPAISYYDITVEKMMADLERKKILVERFAFTEPERYWHYLHHLFPANPFLVSALDMAAWDLYGKIRGLPLYRLWQGEQQKAPPLTDYTIGIDQPEKMLEKMQAHPWPVYKIKVGTPADLGVIELLRKHTSAVFRVDANAGWSLSEALDLIPRLKDLGVELVEQPLAKDDWEGMRELYRHSPLPLIADESCVGEKDLELCPDHFNGINIKLTKCSGPTVALRMIRQARQMNLQVMIGCMNESTVGSAAIAHFLPLLDYVDMDGPLLLAADLATGLNYQAGEVSIPQKPGLGIELTATL